MGPLPAARFFLVFCCTLIASFALSAPPAAAQFSRTRVTSDAASPSVALERTGLTVSAATPGEYVIVFGFERRMNLGSIEARNLVMARASDSAGVARFDFDRPIAATTVLAVVDYATGRYTIATPEGFAVRLRQLPAAAWRGRPDDDFDFVDLDSRWIEALCVRPGKAAWHVFATDGAGLDADRRVDNRMSLGAAQMTPLLGDLASPAKFRPHDIVIIIDPYAMDVVAAEVNR